MNKKLFYCPLDDFKEEKELSQMEDSMASYEVDDGGSYF